jgi:hypothetical protein
MRPAGCYLSSRFRATAQITRICTPEATTPFSIDPCLNQAGRHAVDRPEFRPASFAARRVRRPGTG